MMASLKYLIFVASAVYVVSAEDSKTSEDVSKVKRHAYIAAAPAPVLAYSAYPSHPAEDDGQYWPGKYDNVPATASYPAVPYYAAHPAAEDDGQYWPGKYDKIAPTPYPAAAPHAAVPHYAVQPAAEDDGQYWPGKYDSVHPAAVHPSYPEDDGQYWPGKYDSVHPAAAHPGHPEDDGQYWPGKYDKTHVPPTPAYYAKPPVYPIAYHH